MRRGVGRDRRAGQPIWTPAELLEVGLRDLELDSRGSWRETAEHLRGEIGWCLHLTQVVGRSIRWTPVGRPDAKGRRFNGFLLCRRQRRPDCPNEVEIKCLR